MAFTHIRALPGGGMVRSQPTSVCHVMRRQDVDALVQVEDFGRLLTDDPGRAVLYDITASFAKRNLKHSDIVSLSWSLEDTRWPLLPTRLDGPSDSTPFVISDGVYEYASLKRAPWLWTLPAGALVVDAFLVGSFRKNRWLRSPLTLLPASTRTDPRYATVRLSPLQACTLTRDGTGMWRPARVQ